MDFKVAGYAKFAILACVRSNWSKILPIWSKLFLNRWKVDSQEPYCYWEQSVENRRRGGHFEKWRKRVFLILNFVFGFSRPVLRGEHSGTVKIAISPKLSEIDAIS